MPLYEFACAGCGRRFEVLQPVGETSPECPSCGGSDVKRAISLIAGLGGAPRTGGTSRGCGCGGACACGA